MKKVLITGANGFVGNYLRAELKANGYEVVTTDVAGPIEVEADLLDKEGVMLLLYQTKPDAVIHLAGQSSVGYSWENPIKTLDLNVKTTIHLIDAITQCNPAIRLLVIGSSDQYGVVPQNKFLVDEMVPLNPQSPYAISKCTQENMAIAFSKARNLDILTTRSFNHIGPRQRPGFVVADFSKSIAEVENDVKPIICVGNLDAYRDFTDVKDVVRAYRLLLENGRSREVYNVGSGELRSIREILENLIAISGKEIDIQVNPAKFRPVELYRLGCNHEKLTRDTGWVPKYNIKDSLSDTLNWWRQQTREKETHNTYE